MSGGSLDSEATRASESPIVRAPKRFRPRLAWLQVVPPLVLAACVFLVHDVGYVLSAPYWNDEAWVAVTARYPLSALPAVTSSTPIGWSLLARLFTVGGLQTARLLPLVFAAGAVVAAYVLSRGLGWASPRIAVGAGLLAGIAALLVPAMLIRDDLKQYTADACVALTIVALTSRLERGWSRQWLGILVGASFLGMLVSHATAFMAAAAFAALGLVQLARRAWVRLLEVAVAGTAAGVAMGSVYKLFDARAVVPGLTSYWRLYFPPVRKGPHATWDYLTGDLGHLRGDFGLGPSWVALPLIVAGLVTMVRLGRPITAGTVILLAPEMLALSALKKYPLLDERTSTFLMVVFAVVAAIGVAGVCTLLRSRVGVAAIVPALAAVGLFTAGAFHAVNAHLIPREGVRSQAQYVAGHRRTGDVIIVNLNSNWGFGYYWRHGKLARTDNSQVLQDYIVGFPDQPEILVAPARDAATARAVLDTALQQADRTPGARIWLVRTHVARTERAAWDAALRADRVHPKGIGEAGLSVISRLPH